ncbi:MAG: DNA (cytosine-5-)-methyltransferase [Alkaliphilus sp.]
MSSYTAVSLFAGIGGICAGFNKVGVSVKWANEVDKDACKTYRLNHKKTILKESNIETVSSSDIPSFDILTAGFPCQAFSIAGYQKGFNDQRGNVFFEIIRILRDKKPRAFLLENVKNLKTHDSGNTYSIIKKALSDEGYFLKSIILNSSEYGNIPQNRERIYLIGFRTSEEVDSFTFPCKVKLKKTIHDTIDVSEKKDAKYYYEKSKYYPQLKEAMKNKNTLYQLRRVYIRENKSNLCPTLTANMGTGGHNVPLILDNFGIRKLTPEECLLFQGFNRSFVFPKEISTSASYKQAGNAVVVPVIRRIAYQMTKTMKQFDYKYF